MGAVSKRRDSWTTSGQKNQLELAFMEEDRGEAPKGLPEGTESSAGKCGTESPAIAEQLMEESGIPEAALASDPGTVVERDLSAATGKTGGNSEAGRRGAEAWHPDGQRELHQSAICIWDGRRSAIRSIRFAASASRF